MVDKNRKVHPDFSFYEISDLYFWTFDINNTK